MFVGDKHPISLRSMLGERPAENYPVVIDKPPVSVLRTRSRIRRFP
jgi:hypothetical protein